MTTEEGRVQLSVGKAAWKCLKRNMNEIISLGMGTIALRIVVFLPLLLCADFGGKLPTWMGCVAVAVMYIAGVIPSRFWVRERMRRMVYSRHLNHHQKDVYQKWLKTGLLRYGRGMLWGLPFLAGMVYLTVFRTILDAKTFWMPIRSLAVLAFQKPQPDTGFLVAMALMAVFGLLFAYGWWRDLPIEYLPARSLGPKKTLHWSRRILKKHRKEMRKNTIVNILLSLPGWIGIGVVLGLYVKDNVKFAFGAQAVMQDIPKLLQSPLPTKVLFTLGIVTLLLYVPFWIIRKTRNTALMATLMRENSGSSHSSSHENANSAHPVEPKKVDFHPGLGSAEKTFEQPSPQADGKDAVQEAARRAREAAQFAQEAAEKAAQLAQEAARMAREAAESKKDA